MKKFLLHVTPSLIGFVCVCFLVFAPPRAHTGTDLPELRAEVVNSRQVWLVWSSYYTNCSWTVARGQIKGGYYSAIADKLDETRWADTPNATDRPYYYVAICSNNENTEVTRTREVRVNF